MAGPINTKVQVTAAGGGPLSGESLNDTTSSGGGAGGVTLSNRDLTGATVTDPQSAVDSSSLGESNTITTTADAHSVLSNQNIGVAFTPGVGGSWDSTKLMYVTRLNLTTITGTWNNTGIGIALRFDGSTWIRAWAFRNSDGNWEASATNGTSNVGTGGDNPQATQPAALVAYWYVDSVTEISLVAVLVDGSDNIISREVLAASAPSATAPDGAEICWHDNIGTIKTCEFTLREAWIEVN